MGFDVHVEIDASLGRVWDVLMDVESWPQWTTSMTTVTLLRPGPLALGDDVRIHQPKFGTLIWTVSELNAESSFTWATHRSGITIIAEHRIGQLRPGVVLLTLEVHQSGRLSRLIEAVSKPVAQRYVQREAAGHKQHAEAVIESNSDC